MKYTGPVFRPPVEANTLLLQVTVGCAHNKCMFCTMYKNTKFEIENLEQIEKDLQEAREKHTSLSRIFLINGDAFVLSARRLKEISKKIIEYFPEMEVITMYASVRNLMDKTDEELKDLKKLRINDLWVGVESGNPAAVDYLKKGYTVNDTREQLLRLNKAGIRHNTILMLGAAGKGKGIENAIDTASLINETMPGLIGVTTLGVFPGSELEKEVALGKFTLASELEVLDEQKKLIEEIEVNNIPFYGSHPINTINISGLLPRDKKTMIEALDYGIDKLSDKLLSGVTKRSSL